MTKTMRTLALVAVMTLVAGLAAADDLWLHVRVEGRAGENVKVNLPLALVEKAIPMLPTEHFHGGGFDFDEIHWGHGHRMSIAELRDLWQELKSSPDMTFITVEERDETVTVSKQGGYLLVDTEGYDDESVNVRVPLTVVDALLSGEGESLDLRAAIEALAAHGEGELVAINDDDERVRVWIDGISDAD